MSQFFFSSISLFFSRLPPFGMLAFSSSLAGSMGKGKNMVGRNFLEGFLFFPVLELLRVSCLFAFTQHQ